MLKQRFFGLIKSFIQLESAPSIILVTSTLIAMGIANSPLSDAYFHFLNTEFLGLSVQNWVNEGLMTLFFYSAALEIKREILTGELSTRRKASMPVIAAVGGMIAPALIYILLSHGQGPRGWAIPIATDIAFAMGVLGFLGKRVPRALHSFLLTLATVDDIGAILVIAIFLTKKLSILWSLIGIGLLLVILTVRRFPKKPFIFEFLLAFLLWYATLHSGLNATIAGVLLGFLTPNGTTVELKSSGGVSTCKRRLQILQPWIKFGIMPIFALANGGISMYFAGHHSYLNGISKGVFIGLLFGKPIGIMLASLLGVSFGIATLPNRVRWSHLLGVSCLASIGFTMSFFISTISLHSYEIQFAKTSVLAASLIAAIVGSLFLYSLDRKTE